MAIIFFLISPDVTQEKNDVDQLHPMTEKAQQELKTVETEKRLEKELADAEYGSEDNMVDCSATKSKFLIATTKDWKQRKAMQNQSDYPSCIAGGRPFRLSLRDFGQLALNWPQYK